MGLLRFSRNIYCLMSAVPACLRQAGAEIPRRCKGARFSRSAEMSARKSGRSSLPTADKLGMTIARAQ